MKIIIHQTHLQVADFDMRLEYLRQNITTPGVHLFPELFLTGYPLQDLCLQKPFVDKYNEFLAEIKKWCQDNLDPQKFCLLMGGLDYELAGSGVPVTIKNVIFQYGDKKTDLEVIYTKRLLPNYDIFDEKKYFTKGNTAHWSEIFSKKIGLLICEDMWASTFHDLDPVEDLKHKITEDDIELDAIFNLSASPFNLGKNRLRFERAQEISNYFSCPFLYVNRVGGEDEILFDGESFVSNNEELIARGKSFQQEIIELDFPQKSSSTNNEAPKKASTWEELFQADLLTDQDIAGLHPWSDEECAKVVEALAFGVQDYAKKSGFKKFSIALSGGMDSALVLTILRLSLKEGQQLEAIYMPSIHSSPLSYDLSLELCQKLGIPLTTLPIKFLHSTAKNLFSQSFQEPFEGLADENIQSRIRGMLIYARSNQIGSMVVNTSNKSEIAVGYSTQYGDSVGAISMLGDLYKSQVYWLANYLNRTYDNIIPEQIITRPPTAELREGQVDTESLPPYERLDAILEGILNYRYSQKDLEKLNLPTEEIKRTFQLYKRNEFKRYQFCPILKISSKSFGFGYRIPVSKHSGFYHS